MSPITTYIVETFFTLVGVVLLAVVVLYGARRLGVGRPVGPLELVGRLPLEGRRAVYLVRVGRAAFVIGASERGLTRLGEMDASTLGPVTGAVVSSTGGAPVPSAVAPSSGGESLRGSSLRPASFAEVLSGERRGARGSDADG